MKITASEGTFELNGNTIEISDDGNAVKINGEVVSIGEMTKPCRTQLSKLPDDHFVKLLNEVLWELMLRHGSSDMMEEWLYPLLFRLGQEKCKSWQAFGKLTGICVSSGNSILKRDRCLKTAELLMATYGGDSEQYPLPDGADYHLLSQLRMDRERRRVVAG